MVYALHKFQHYLLGTPFKLFTDHSTLKYLVKNPVLGGENLSLVVTLPRIQIQGSCQTEGKYNVRPDHLSRIEFGEAGRSLMMNSLM
jgi:hypothetical protein